MVKETLISEIQKYINNNGGMTSGYGWYMGVTADPKRQLFREHNVNEQNAPWIYGAVASDYEARYIKNHFLEQGCRCSPIEGDYDAIYVYAYHINLYTQE